MPQVINYEKTFAVYFIDTGLITKNSQKLRRIKDQQTDRKNEQVMNRRFIEKQIKWLNLPEMFSFTVKNKCKLNPQ